MLCSHNQSIKKKVGIKILVTCESFTIESSFKNIFFFIEMRTSDHRDQ